MGSSGSGSLDPSAVAYCHHRDPKEKENPKMGAEHEVLAGRLNRTEVVKAHVDGSTITVVAQGGLLPSGIFNAKTAEVLLQVIGTMRRRTSADVTTEAARVLAGVHRKIRDDIAESVRLAQRQLDELTEAVDQTIGVIIEDADTDAIERALSSERARLLNRVSALLRAAGISGVIPTVANLFRDPCVCGEADCVHDHDLHSCQADPDGPTIIWLCGHSPHETRS